MKETLATNGSYVQRHDNFWFLKIVSVWTMRVHLHVCPPLRLLITSGVI